MADKNEFYILFRLKGTVNNIENDVFFINGYAKDMNETFGCGTVNILGIGITKSAMRDTDDSSNYTINRNQIYVIIHIKDMKNTYPYMYYCYTQEDGSTVGVAEVEHNILDIDGNDSIIIDRLIKNGLYKKVQNNYIESKTVRELLDIRKQRNKYERSTN